MKRFFRDLSLFLLPFLPLFGFPFYVLLASGELASLRTVVESAEGGSPGFLYGPAYTNDARSFKIEMTARRRPEVLALGSSRVMQFRADYFSRPERFYNAGGGVSDIAHFRRFLRSLPDDGLPRAILMGLDQYYFNPDWDNAYGGWDLEDAHPYRRAWSTFVSSWKKVYADFLGGKFSLEQVASRRPGRIGLSAVTTGNGFRADGSYRYGRQTRARSSSPGEADEEARFGEEFRRIENGNMRFEFGERISQAALDELDSALAFCRSRRIHVTGILPPFPHAVVSRMTESGRYAYLSGLPSEVQRVFGKHGYLVFDFTDPLPHGFPDGEFVDGLHGSEVTYLRMLRTMSGLDGTLRPYLNVSSLDVLLASRLSPWEVVHREP